MFRALYAFFQMIILVVLFKLFAPGVYSLLVEMLTQVLTIANAVLNHLANQTPTL
ncbi:MAG: hypothetical protein WC465_02450 [Patescibacteria group bacterium]